MMRTSDFGETRGEIGLLKKLEREAAAWRKRRIVRANVSMSGVQVVRVPKRRPSRRADHSGLSRP